MAKRFTRTILEEFNATKYLHIRAGGHRFIPIWVVVVQGRVIVRSWNDKPEGWYRAFLQDKHGAVKIEGKEVPIKALRVRSTRINDSADTAYALKYTTKANAKYVEGLRQPRRKAASLELVPGK